VHIAAADCFVSCVFYLLRDEWIAPPGGGRDISYFFLLISIGLEGNGVGVAGLACGTSTYLNILLTILRSVWLMTDTLLLLAIHQHRKRNSKNLNCNYLQKPVPFVLEPCVILKAEVYKLLVHKMKRGKFRHSGINSVTSTQQSR